MSKETPTVNRVIRVPQDAKSFLPMMLLLQHTEELIEGLSNGNSECFRRYKVQVDAIEQLL